MSLKFFVGLVLIGLAGFEALMGFAGRIGGRLNLNIASRLANLVAARFTKNAFEIASYGLQRLRQSKISSWVKSFVCSVDNLSNSSRTTASQNLSSPCKDAGRGPT